MVNPPGKVSLILVLFLVVHGMEEFQQLMAADILFTPVASIVKSGLIYAGLGCFILLVVRRTSGKLKDMAFFLAFAVTVTSSVKLAGVLVVFAILIGPAVIACQLTARWRLVVAWGLGTLINLAAIIASFYRDLPTGYALVFLHAAIAMAVCILRGLKWAELSCKT